ncbi:MAG: hypothetical protein R6V62_08490 [Candidatus Fermentibacteraceae bacterium]
MLSWTVLGASLLALLWSGWYWAVPAFYAFALSLTAGVENSSRQSPATALGVTIHGEKTYGMKLLRIGLTPPLLLMGMVGYIKCFKGGLSLPETASRTDFRELDLQLDPRPRAIVMEGRKVAKRWVTAYTTSAIIVSTAMFLLANPLTDDNRLTSEQDLYGEMSESDRQLLTMYLELAALHPDELEYHVRLASLYHRNNMLPDLENQLSEIRRLNPEHALLVLGDTTRIVFDDLVTIPDPLIPDSSSVMSAQPDSTVTPPDSITEAGSEVLLETAPDQQPTETQPQEELPEALPDTMETQTPSDQEQDPVQP